jgi:hypothetical protein
MLRLPFSPDVRTDSVSNRLIAIFRACGAFVQHGVTECTCMLVPSVIPGHGIPCVTARPRRRREG